jgi:hypothetical protein
VQRMCLLPRADPLMVSGDIERPRRPARTSSRPTGKSSHLTSSIVSPPAILHGRLPPQQRDRQHRDPYPEQLACCALLSAACLPMDASQVPRVRAAVNDGLLPPAKPPNGRSSRTPPSPETHEPCRSSAVTRRSQRFERRVKRIPERHVPRISRQGSSHLARHIRVADAAIWVGKPE